MITTFTILSGVISALLSLGGTFSYRRSGASKGMLQSQLALFALTGFLGLIAAIAITRGIELVGILVLSLVFGVLIALIPITIMSIAPLTALCTAGLGISLLLAITDNTKYFGLSITSLFISSIITFMLLLWITNTSGLEKLVSTQSATIVRSFPSIDYQDTFQIHARSELTENIKIIGNAFLISMKPWWLRMPEPSESIWIDFEPGNSFGGWDTYIMSEDELIIGLDRSFIDLRISLLVNQRNDTATIAATTVARYNNIWGRLYFLPVRFGHQIVLADTMRRIPLILPLLSRS